jgi:ribosomal protein S18 acetylase RimI-like enzyme
MSNTNSLKSQLILRDKRPSDDDFIIDAWIKGLRGNTMLGAMPQQIYFKKASKLIQFIHGRSYAIIAADKTDDSVIFGFCVFRFVGNIPVIPYVYVKGAFRKLGIGTMLLNEVSKESKIITNMNPRKEKFFSKRNCIYDAFMDWEEYYGRD